MPRIYLISALIMFTSVNVFPQNGIIVDRIQSGSNENSVEFALGDVFLRWERLGGEPIKGVPNEREISSPASFYVDTLDLDFHGPVRISGLRDGKTFSYVTITESLQIVYRPRFPNKFESEFEIGAKFFKTGKPDQAIEVWLDLAQKLEKEGLLVYASWLNGRIGKTYMKKNEQEKGWEYLQKSNEQATLSNDIPTIGMNFRLSSQPTRGCLRLG